MIDISPNEADTLDPELLKVCKLADTRDRLKREQELILSHGMRDERWANLLRENFKEINQLIDQKIEEYSSIRNKNFDFTEITSKLRKGDSK